MFTKTARPSLKVSNKAGHLNVNDHQSWLTHSVFERVLKRPPNPLQTPPANG